MACLIAASPVYAADAGMFLCRSPVVANDFWSALLAAQQSGITVNRAIARSIAEKNQCQFLASKNLKPVDFVAGELAITDGTVKGWADPHLYIIYINRSN